ncbi:acriflavin resistance protein [Crinalium epipsammum PCC 9333]|uniref:Acriflavin resistance protein n=1 Tax=Crinalium epipsammum PCC 9333 TaxID=1173022 RepID=K9VZC5_9CYAN|nr:efflux RND transporter permease subunit [Crinalium epipsammum]AFZ13321.1 acriflavin resistance protein [Crinalium epipsammum PCC 9333]
MSFNLSAWSIKKPVPTLVLFLVLALLGWISFTQLGIDTNPNIDVPTVSITAIQPGAGPAELESEVTKKIEDAVAGLGNIDTIISTVKDGNSTTVVNFVIGTDTDRATNDIRNAVAQIRQNLPQDLNDPIVQRLDFAGGAIMTYAVVSEQQSVEDLSNLVDQDISRALLAVRGVAQIKRVGGVDREIRINLAPERLQSLGITATQVNEQIRTFNANLPGGRAEVGGSEQSIRTLGSATTVEALKNYQITLPNGSFVALSSLGEVSDRFGDVRQSALLNNKPVVAFQVLRSTGSTLVTVEEGVRSSVAELHKKLPTDVKIELIFTRADFIRESYESTIDDLIVASVLAVVTILIFLRDWRSTLITAVALPLSMLPTFWIQKSLGYTLNNMTLLGLALAIGNLVDDSVVEVENMQRHMAMGKTPRQAAFDSSAEVGLAVLASAATIIAVFLPVAFMGGIPGQFFQPFGMTVAISTFFSTLVARTITPMMGAYLLKAPKPSDAKSKSKGGFRPYFQLLKWALRHRLTTMAIAVAFFMASLTLVPLIPKGFVDSSDISLSTVLVELPPGSTLNDTTQVAQQATAVLQQSPAVNSVLAAIDVNTATLTIQLKAKEERPNLSQSEFEKQSRQPLAKIPGARISFQSQGGGGASKDVSIVLKSENPEALNQAALALEKQMRELPMLVEVSSSASLVKPEILIIPDPIRAADLGVTVQAIARTASLATIGDNESNLAKFNLSDRQIPIRVQINPQERLDIDTIKNLQVPGQNNSLVPLSAVADIRFGNGPAQINRYNRARQVSVQGNLQGASLGEAMETVKALPAMNPLPAGVVEESAGDAKIMQEIFGRFGGALALALTCIYAILVLLYNNFLHPITIMAALPFCLGGALLGLMISQKSLGIYALIGIVLLMGIVTKNSILLVDYTLIFQQEGKPQFHSVMAAGLSRLRPILMTSLASIAGTLPLALGIGAGAEVRSPMGVAILGGFTTSTLLTLLVVPVLFTYIDDLQNWILHLLQHGFTKKPKRKLVKDEL